MARRFTGARTFRGAARRRQPTNWARSVAAAYVTIPLSSKALITTVLLSNPGIGETVRRTRGVLSVVSDQSASLEVQLGAFGMVVVNDLAVAAGAASIPGPVTDASDDGWFVWLPIMQTGAAPAGGGATQSLPQRYEFDSKAMRRVEEGFAIALMIENSSATNGLAVACGISILTSLS